MYLKAVPNVELFDKGWFCCELGGRARFDLAVNGTPTNRSPASHSLVIISITAIVNAPHSLVLKCGLPVGRAQFLLFRTSTVMLEIWG